MSFMQKNNIEILREKIHNRLQVQIDSLDNLIQERNSSQDLIYFAILCVLIIFFITCLIKAYKHSKEIQND